MRVLQVYGCSGAKLDLGDGGAYPECNVVQYPLGMGKKQVCAALIVFK